MLFNSVEFIFFFLPIVFLASYFLGGRIRIFVLFGASLFFLGFFDVGFAAILLGYIAVNHVLARLMNAHRRHRDGIFLVGIAANLLPLVYFKYSAFLTDLARFEFESGVYINDALPLGISFYAFQQIFYLHLVRSGRVEPASALHFSGFVSFFPQLIAGPITDPRRVIPQLARARRRAVFLAAGISIFSVGLFKKVLIADQIAPTANRVFDALALGQPVAWFEALAGMLAFSLQLYFDFSAYSDMAVGLGCLFFIKLPLNFYSPYKSTNILEFWRRWHITLGRFFHAVFYLPLSDRLGRGLMIFATFVAVGVWHGAGMTFVLFGAYHGAGAIIYIVYRRVLGGVVRIPAVIAIAVTFVYVVGGFAIFRADGLGTVGNLLSSLGARPDGGPAAGALAVTAYLGAVDYGLLFAGTLFVFLLPATVQLFPGFFDTRDAPHASGILSHRCKWRPNIIWAVFVAILLLAALLRLGEPSEFLYFQF